MRALLLAVVVGGATGAAGCVSSQTVYYTPTVGESRLNTDDARSALDQVLGAECARLTAARQETGEARVMLDVARDGLVQRSRIAKGSGDERIDQVIGAVTARLRFDSPQGEFKGETAPGVVKVGYSCSASGAAVATLQVL